MLLETDPAGHTTTYEYDTQGDPIKVTTLAGTAGAATWRLAYLSGTSLVTEETDPLGHTTKYRYGVHDELLERIDPMGHATHLEYEGTELAAATIRWAGRPISATRPAT